MVEVTLHVPIKSNIVHSLFTSCDRMFGSDGPSFAKYMFCSFSVNASTRFSISADGISHIRESYYLPLEVLVGTAGMILAK